MTVHDGENRLEVKVRLMSFPAHELDYLCKQLKQNRNRVISEALIMFAAYWKEHYDKKRREKNLV